MFGSISPFHCYTYLAWPLPCLLVHVFGALFIYLFIFSKFSFMYMCTLLQLLCIVILYSCSFSTPKRGCEITRAWVIANIHSPLLSRAGFTGGQSSTLPAHWLLTWGWARTMPNHAKSFITLSLIVITQSPECGLHLEGISADDT